ncbi:electron transfer flavoprotein-ubiquinone oxidoreductase [Shewanella dokdonensis]|uniref:Electron transfer flavoprotein-ubiquinone oxidoreductase n=1 Tax=Shewanella dokdonensis TaxID=712036 RepID=A0ABX8DJ27_9GAMM|nr:electron transfer flavoprotein-ubiquinone oxidoreductase [Shewanella dokdonensis]MCL1076173.1 electron transfer flavoprotein-ubiquinone oxidoreductase [Shewanella dokdonensis]QVK24793.1 electron transfer flavoprotein-ubiquinone oxidoreductase [Shewanella dokdonensis]
MERESMEFDVVIVGAGPAGLATACRLLQISKDAGNPLNVCVVEKGAEVGAHIMSGAVFEPTVLEELFGDWKSLGAPLDTAVSSDEFLLLQSSGRAREMPQALIPKTMTNDGNYIISAGNLCRWLAQQAEALGAEIFPGFAASELLFNDDGSVKGILTGDMGVAKDGTPKDGYMPGMELLAKYTVFAEGCRGHLGKQLIQHFHLDNGKSPQHYALGFKEIWQIPAAQHQLGKVIHTAGWPLSQASGGGFLYHLPQNQVAVGLIVDLNYSNPHLSPFEEFQRYKTHPKIAAILQQGQRLSYGARAIAKGGLNSLPKMSFPGGLLIGCDAGTLNFAKIKGIHTAMKSGMLAAETLVEAMLAGVDAGKDLNCLQTRIEQSSLYDELHRARNFGPALHKFGTLLGGAFNFVEQNWFDGKFPLTLRDDKADFACLGKACDYPNISYPAPDGKLTFDRLSSIYLANIGHDEDQPCHLQLENASVPLAVNLPLYDEPAQRYCPAGVYEVTEDAGEKRFVINAQNCIHCKTCDIKDPSQNINWVVPEGGSGPNYSGM